MFPNKLCKLWTLGGLKTLTHKTDVCSSIEHCLVNGQLHTVWLHTVLVDADFNDVEYLRLILDMTQITTLCFRWNRNTYVDFLLISTVMLLFLFSTMTLRYRPIENNCSICMLRLYLYFQRIYGTFNNLVQTLLKILGWSETMPQIARLCFCWRRTENTQAEKQLMQFRVQPRYGYSSQY